ncbi:MAG: PH domain-containing protein [Candidatus Helarchaeota archaeon]
MTRKEILWEGNPSKEVCNKDFFHFMIIAILMGLIPLFLLLPLTDILNLDINDSLFIIQLIIIFLIVGLSCFMFIMVFYLAKSTNKEKWKKEKYTLSNIEISLKTVIKMMTSETTINKTIPIRNFYQYQFLKGITARLYNINAGNIYFYDKNTSIPKIIFSNILNPDEVKSHLDNLLIQNRLKYLEENNKEPFNSIDWKLEVDSRGIIFITLLKIGITIGVIIGPYLYFGILFSYVLEELDWNLINQFYFYFIAIPLIIIFSIYFIITANKFISQNYVINDLGIQENSNNNILIELNEIKYFIIKNPTLVRSLKRDSPTISFYKDSIFKPTLKIRAVMNYKDLRDRLIDNIYLKNKITPKFKQIIDNTHEEITQSNLQSLHTDDIIPEIDINTKNLEYLKSYITLNEKILRVIRPDLRSSKKRSIMSILLTFIPVIIVIMMVMGMIFSLSWLFNSPIISELFSYLLFPIFLFFLIIIIFIIGCSVGGIIITFQELKKTEYIISNKKLIIKSGKIIQFIPYEHIESISIIRTSSDKLLKLNTADISILIKSGGVFKAPKYYRLASINNPDEIRSLIDILRENRLKYS